MSRLLGATLAWALPTLALAGARDPYGPVTEGSMRVVQPNGAAAEMPLQHTDVQAEISGFVARVKVEQTFQNPYSQPIEAVYAFPLPDRGGVDSMTLTVGDRVVHGEIKKRQEARAIYEQAKSRGQTAALLDQERPNIFTQSVANIAPGLPIRVALTYVAPLEYDHGEYTFNFPMVVGPRYIPGSPLVGESQGGGWANDTDRVDDASRITPPVLAAGQRSGHDISLSVRLDAGVSIQNIRSVSHDVTITRSGQREARVELKAGDAIPNKDFVLRYQVAGHDLQAGILTHRDDRGGYFALMIQPQAEFRQTEVTPKEMFFVIDQSCSQSGLPIEKEKGIVNEALDKMNPADTFQIMTFNNGVHFFAPHPLENTAANVHRARNFVNGLIANGGTEMLSGVVACLTARRDPERLRFVMFLTDGYVGNDNEIIHAVESHVGDARLYTYGVGSSVNHYLLDRMAEVGRGYTQYARPDEETRKSVSLFYERIAKPFLVDVSVDFGDVGVKEVYPKVIRDLFASQPIILTGRFDGPGGPGTVSLKGRVAGQPHLTKVSVEMPRGVQSENEALAAMFGRARIEHLSAEQYGGHKREIVQEITDTALQYHLISPYTSFVAVEEHRVAGADGRPVTVMQAVQAPDGTHFGDDEMSEGLMGKRAAGPAGGTGLGMFGLGAGGGGKGAPASMGHLATRGAEVRGHSDPGFGSIDLGGSATPSHDASLQTASAPPPPAADAPDSNRRIAAAKPVRVASAEPVEQPAASAWGHDVAKDDERKTESAFDKAPALAPMAHPEATKKKVERGASFEIVDVMVKGPLARSDAQLVLHEVLRRLARRSVEWGNAQGTLLVRIAVGANGAVTAVDILQDGAQVPQLIVALSQSLKSTQFPGGSDATTLTVSLRVR
jgi:Ca-activated chloride channel family protein